VCASCSVAGVEHAGSPNTLSEFFGISNSILLELNSQVRHSCLHRQLDKCSNARGLRFDGEGIDWCIGTRRGGQLGLAMARRMDWDQPYAGASGGCILRNAPGLVPYRSLNARLKTAALR
jgi:hypothetical protein